VSPKVHRTVYQRIARNTEGYAPGTVPPDAEVITSSSTTVAQPLRELVSNAHAGKGPLVGREHRKQLSGQAGYWTMMLSLLGVMWFIAATYIHDLRNAPNWKAGALALVTTVASTNWFGVIARTAWHHWWLAAGAFLGLALMIVVAHRLDNAYSEFWHQLRAPMRDLLEKP
jgi:hypothetical protein